MAGLDDRRVKCCFRSDARLTGRILFNQLLDLFSQAENISDLLIAGASGREGSCLRFEDQARLIQIPQRDFHVIHIQRRFCCLVERA